MFKSVLFREGCNYNECLIKLMSYLMFTIIWSLNEHIKSNYIQSVHL